MAQKARPLSVQKKTPAFSIRFLLLLFMTVVSTVSFFCSGVIESQDGWLYLSVSKNIYYNHVIESAPDEYPTLNVHINSTKDENGRWHSTGSLGYSFVMVPAVALSDVTHKILHTVPSNHFPLEHDWTLHFYASFTNAVLAGVLVILVTLYFYDLTEKKWASVATGLLSLFATNLLPLSKFAFAHILFTIFVVLCFYAVRRLVLTSKKKYVLLFGASAFGMYISYNVSYYIPLMPLVVYYILLTPRKQLLKKLLYLLVPAITFVIWKFKTLILLTGYFNINAKILFEGIWGFLFSPGKSAFLYSPPLIIPVLFWHKIGKKYLPEVLSFSFLALLYLYLFGTAWISNANGVLSPIWHGGMSWGPRYVSTLIPFVMILCGMVCVHVSNRIRYFVIAPIILGGIFIQLIGISLPYQLQYQGTPPYSIYIGEQELSVYDYGSFVPRFSPLYVMTRDFFGKIKRFKSTVDHGKYNVRFYDGFEVPLFTGLGPYRGFRSEGHIFFKNEASDPVQKIFMRFYNAQDFPTSSSSAELRFSINSKVIGEVSVPSNGNAQKELIVDPVILTAGQNRLDITADYPATTSAQQVVYIAQMVMNDTNVNLESLDYPEISTGGSSTSKIPYQYYGNRMNDNWKLWYLRARISERTFDFWWIKNLYYWDRPHIMMWMFFILNTATIGVSCFLLIRAYHQSKGNS